MSLLLLALVGGQRMAYAEPPSPRLVATLADEQETVLWVAFSPDGKTIATGKPISRKADRVALWEVATQRPRASLPGFAMGQALAFSPDGKILATMEDDYEVHLWDLESGKDKVSNKNAEMVTEISFSPDGKILAFGDMRGSVKVLNVADGKELTTLKCKESVYGLAFSPDGKALAAVDSTFRGHGSGEIRLWDVADWRLRATFGDDLGVSLRHLTFSPDGKTLASSDVHDKVFLWDPATGRLKASWEPELASIGCLAFSPDGRVLVAGGGPLKLPGFPAKPGKVKFRDVTSGKEILTLMEAHKDSVGSLALSPDGRLLAVVSRDKTVNLWDVSAITGKPPADCPSDPTGKGDARPPPDPAAKLTAEQLDGLWSGLAQEDAKKAYRAIWSLAGDPKQAVPFLAERLKAAVAPDAKEVQRLLADLDSDTFAVRQKATEALEGLGDLIAPALKKELERPRSADLGKRLEALLEKAEGVPPPERLRALRSIEALEHAGTADAVRLLETLAKGAPEARLTREACAALHRLSRPD